MNMDKSNGNTPETRNFGTRQVGGIVPAPDRSEARSKSYEGPSGELPASSPLDTAITRDSICGGAEGDQTGATRPSLKRRSPRARNP